MPNVNRGGRTLATQLRGKGEPLVVFESGLGDGAGPWRIVQTALSARTATLSYDRAGYGASPTASTRSVDAMLQDLQAVVASAGTSQPPIVVAHSLGAFLALAYADRARAAVAGLVLVDPTHERRFRESGDASALGAELSDTARREREAFRAFAASGALARMASFGNLPITVLIAGDGERDVASLSPRDRPIAEAMIRNHVALWREQTPLSDAWERRVVSHAGHYVQLDAPEAVITAVDALIAGRAGA